MTRLAPLAAVFAFACGGCVSRDGFQLLSSWCGDGVVDPGEACDDGNDSPNDDCNNECLPLTVPCDLVVNNASPAARDDAGAGTSASPLASLSYAATRLVNTLGTLCVLGGPYNERPTFIVSGVPGAPLRLRALETVRVNGGLVVEGSDVELSGFEVRAPAGSSAATLDLLGDRLKVHDMTVVGGEPLVWSVGTDNVFERNTLRATADDQLIFRFFGDRHVFRGNTNYGGRYAYETYDSEHTSSDTLIEGNVCWDSVGACVSVVGDFQQVTARLVVRNNVFDGGNGVTTTGIEVQGIPDAVIANNLFTAGFAHAAWWNRDADAVVNNLLLGPGAFTGAARRISHNLQAGGGCELTVGQGSCTPDAGFQNVSEPDLFRRFRLAPGSPAVDAGTTDSISSTDLVGAPRVLDGDGNGSALPDVGPLELAP